MDKDNKKNTEDAILNNVFYNKPLYIYLFKKVTKVCEAIYMVTDLIKDNEPIKRSLRNYALNCVTLSNFIKDGNASFALLCGEILTLRNLLEVAKNHQFIGMMNYSLLDKELSDLGTLLNQEIILGGTLSEDFFYVATPAPHTDLKDTLTKQKGQIHALGASVFYKGYNKRQESGVSFKNPDADRVPQKDNKANRRQQIIDIIKQKENLTIKDIASTIKDCSEKTIQRELVQMLSLGLIKKTGERRWSRYTAA